MTNIVPGMKTTNKGVVQDQAPYGMYVWRMPGGEVLGDGDGNIMNVFCAPGDRRAIAALTEAAKGYGFSEGKPEWWGGKRRITDEELAEQETREKLGLEPDPLNYGAIMDEMRAKKHGQ